MKIVAIQECAKGNERVGEMWLETKVFDSDQAISDVIKWADNSNGGGKLIITVEGRQV